MNVNRTCVSSLEETFLPANVIMKDQLHLNCGLQLIQLQNAHLEQHQHKNLQNETKWHDTDFKVIGFGHVEENVIKRTLIVIGEVFSDV